MGSAVSQALLSTTILGRGVTANSQSLMMVAHTLPVTKHIRSSNQLAEVSTLGRGVAASSHLVVLAAYRTGSVENLKNRAWSYSLDGHTFYVITIGEMGTYVYNQATHQWCQWQTQGLSGWNMEIGTTWKGKIIAADQNNPVIWQLTPDKFIDDDFKPQIRRVTGALPLRRREFLENYSFYINTSISAATLPVTIPETKPTVRLRFSDDQGETFVDMGEIELTSSNPKQQFHWNSLGMMNAPQRIFEIEDVGAIVRIDGADADLGDTGNED